VAQHGGRLAPTVEEAARDAQVVLLCVGNDNDVREVAHLALEAMRPGTLLVDHTTASASLARELHALAKAQGVGFLDAPVSGGQAGAQNGKLTVMVGGDAHDYAKAEALLGVYARAVTHMGAPGTGQLTKMVNQIFLAGLIEALAEGLDFASRAGLDTTRVVEVLSKGAAQSWQMDNRAKTMIADEYDFGFAVDWMRKDLGMCLEEARRCGATLPVTALVDQLYARVQQLGGGRWDTSSLLRGLRTGG
jgi:3-hydroxyisobutyrate dehydrogenase